MRLVGARPWAGQPESRVYWKRQTTTTTRKGNRDSKRIPRGEREHTKSRTEIAGTAVCCSNRGKKRKTSVNSRLEPHAASARLRARVVCVRTAQGGREGLQLTSSAGKDDGHPVLHVCAPSLRHRSQKAQAPGLSYWRLIFLTCKTILTKLS